MKILIKKEIQSISGNGVCCEIVEEYSGGVPRKSIKTATNYQTQKECHEANRKHKTPGIHISYHWSEDGTCELKSYHPPGVLVI
jgi:hypothetical protein